MNLMKQIIKLLFLFTVHFSLFINNCSAQFTQEEQTQIDSLNAVINNTNNPDSAIANAYIYLSDVLYVSNIDTLIPLCKKAKEIAEVNLLSVKLTDKEQKLFNKILASAFNNIGFWYQEKGETTKALEWYNQSLTKRKKINDKMGMADSYLNLGYIYNNFGDVAKGLEFYHEALKIHEELNNQVGIANSCNNIGYIYELQGEREKSLEYHLRSLQIREALNDSYGIAISLNNIGAMYNYKKDYLTALKYFQRALDLYKKVGDENGAAIIYNNIGSVYINLGETEKSLENYKKAATLQYKNKEIQGLTTSYGNIGKTYTNQKLYAKARHYLDSSLIMAKQVGYPEEIRDAAILIYDLNNKESENLGLSQRKLELYMEAQKMYELYVQMKDSVYNETNKNSAYKQEIKYQYEKAQAIKDAETAQQMEIAAEKEKRQKTISIAIFIGALLIAAFAFFVWNRLKLTRKQKIIIEKQKHLVDEKQKEIIDSINYARRIQYTLLAQDSLLQANLKDYFVFFNPKDIVSGDFYYAIEKENYFFLACCDSTGHGVPGAFMSLLNISFLNEAITERGLRKPNEILDYARVKLIENMSKEGQKDGFDGILICMDKLKNSITYSAANNAPILVSNSTYIELQKNKMPVGVGERKEPFTLHEVNCKEGDILYLYTDGYADQFGGDRGKKYKYKPLNELLAKNSSMTLSEQKEKLREDFTSWRGEHEQIDDVLVIGIRM